MSERQSTEEGRDEWDYESVQLGRSKAPSAVYSVRFTADEIRRVREAAARLRQTPSQFIREAACRAATQSTIQVYFDFTNGAEFLSGRTSLGSGVIVSIAGELEQYGAASLALTG